MQLQDNYFEGGPKLNLSYADSGMFYDDSDGSNLDLSKASPTDYYSYSFFPAYVRYCFQIRASYSTF